MPRKTAINILCSLRTEVHPYETCERQKVVKAGQVHTNVSHGINSWNRDQVKLITDSSKTHDEDQGGHHFAYHLSLCDLRDNAVDQLV